MMGSKRVLHFIESGGVYGAERVILNLSQKMQLSSDYIPVVGCIVNRASDDSALYDVARAQGIEAHKIPIGNSRLLRDIPRAATQLRTLGIDLIHSHGYKPSVFGFFISRITRIKIMATCHLWFDPKNGPLKMRAMIWLEKKFYRRFPKVVAVSEPIKDVLIANHIPAKNVAVVRNGVEVPSHFLSAAEVTQLRTALGLGEHDFFVLNAGRLARQKAQWTLIQTAAIFKREALPIRILIIGEGPLREELQNLITAEQLENQVRLLGFRDDIDKLLAVCDVFALPSLDEGMPMSLLEAAAANKPIISTLVGDIGKLVADGETGSLVPTEDATALANAILRIKNDPEFAQRIAHNAHQQLVMNYSSQAMCDRYIDIYNDVINQV